MSKMKTQNALHSGYLARFGSLMIIFVLVSAFWLVPAFAQALSYSGPIRALLAPTGDSIALLGVIILAVLVADLVLVFLFGQIRKKYRQNRRQKEKSKLSVLPED